MTAGPWRVEAHRGSAAEFHARDIVPPAVRSLWWLEIDRPALVLGSTQPASVVDEGASAAAGVELVRRRSGGGAVLLVPGQFLWVDVIVPAGDALWDDDVGRAAWWLGDAWAAALAACGVAGAEAHRGGMVCTPWSRLICFAGLGPGEVHVGGRKVVGLSQRRTRGWARFQCAAYRRWDPEALVPLLADPRPAVEDLAATVLELDTPTADLRAALEAALP